MLGLANMDTSDIRRAAELGSVVRVAGAVAVTRIGVAVGLVTASVLKKYIQRVPMSQLRS